MRLDGSSPGRRIAIPGHRKMQTAALPVGALRSAWPFTYAEAGAPAPPLTDIAGVPCVGKP